jgi:hypothetical protein
VTPVDLIMKISGHKSLRDFYRYISHFAGRNRAKDQRALATKESYDFNKPLSTKVYRGIKIK